MDTELSAAKASLLEQLRNRGLAAAGLRPMPATPMGTGDGHRVPDAAAEEAAQFELTPNQHWFLGLDRPESRPLDQIALLELDEKLSPLADPGLLEDTLRVVIDRHDALRLRWEQTADGWRQHCAPSGELKLAVVDIDGYSQAEYEQRARAEIGRIQDDYSFGQDPPLAAVWFVDGARGRTRMLFAAHHFIVDGASWPVFFAEFTAVCVALGLGKQVALPPAGTSYRQWADGLRRYAGSPQLLAELPGWQETVAAAGASLRVDHPGAANGMMDERQARFGLSVAQTELLNRRARQIGAGGVPAVLLAAFGDAVGPLAEPGDLLVNVVNHGRLAPLPDVDLARTIGWFAHRTPVALPVGPADKSLPAVAERLNSVPYDGVGYGILRYLAGADGLDARPQVTLNYLGAVDWTEQPGIATQTSDPLSGSLVRPAPVHNSDLLHLQLWQLGGRLEGFIRYSDNCYRPETVKALAGRFTEALGQLAGEAEHGHRR